MAHPLQWRRAFAAIASVLLAVAFIGPARAQDDPPGRVGRLADLQGAVSWYDADKGAWADAERNRPLTSGDRLVTAPRATAELRIGSTVARLSEASELELVRVDDQRISLRLYRGSLALRVRTREIAGEVELLTAEARLWPQRQGLYRLDRRDDVTQATAWRGALRVDERDGFTVEAGQRVELRRGAGLDFALRTRFGAPAGDGFAAWVASEDRRDEQQAASSFVSPEMTGAEDLDRHGRWEQHPEFGAVWMPMSVAVDWAPYRYGRWAWVRPWGWTWVDDAPWGFAPFHYGRWVRWQERWAWCPGEVVARPVFAPALVAWVGGPHFSLSVRLGPPPPASWVPLAPREVFRPYYRATPGYEDRVNHRHARDRETPNPPQVPTGPIMRGGVPSGVTVVSRDALQQRAPAPQPVVDLRDVPRGSTAPTATTAPVIPAASLPGAPATVAAPPPVATAPLPRWQRAEADRDRDGARMPMPAAEPPRQAPVPAAAPSPGLVGEARRDRGPVRSEEPRAERQPERQAERRDERIVERREEPKVERREERRVSGEGRQRLRPGESLN